MQLRETSGESAGFERSLPFKFRAFLLELGAAVTPGGNGIVIYRGFKAIATLSRSDAENLSEAEQMAIRKAFNAWGDRTGTMSWSSPHKVR
jgi:hypothetical protein